MSDSTDFQAVCSTEDVTEDEPHVEDVDGLKIALFCSDGEYYALNNTCPHQGGPLGAGRVEDGCVYCPWHGWQFDLESGSHVHNKGQATSYDVRVEDGQVLVDLSG